MEKFSYRSREIYLTRQKKSNVKIRADKPAHCFVFLEINKINNLRDRDTVLITMVLFRQLREPQIATLTSFWGILLQQIQHFPHNIPFEVLNGFLSVLSVLPLVAQISHFSHSIPSEAGLLDYDLSCGPAYSFVECMLSITCLPKRPELMHIYMHLLKI